MGERAREIEDRYASSLDERLGGLGKGWDEQLKQRTDEITANHDGKLDERTAAIDKRHGEQLDRRLREMETSRTDDVRRRIEELAAQQDERMELRMGKLERRLSDVGAEIQRLGRHLIDLEAGLPGVAEQFQQLKDSVAHGYRSELAELLGSFDTAVDAVLSQMQGEMQSGLEKVEHIQEMVRSWEEAHNTVLGHRRARPAPRRATEMRRDVSSPIENPPDPGEESEPFEFDSSRDA